MLKKAFLLAVASVALSLLISQASLFGTIQTKYTQESSRYTVGEYRGMVAAFRGTEARPFQVLYSYVAALPDNMAEQIRSGIPARSEKELVEILEEYSS